MKIAVDARAIKKYPGLARYCVGILRGLSEIDTENQYVVYTLGNERLGFLKDKPNFKLVEVGYPVLSWQTFHAMSRLINAQKPDVFFAAFQVAPLSVEAPMVLVMHDMMDLMYPQAFTHHNLLISTGLKYYFRYAIPRSVARAREIITVSEATRQHLISYFNLPAERAVSVLTGVEDSFHPVHEAAEHARVRGKYNLPARFILYLGSIKPYKNLQGAVAAFARLHERGFQGDVALAIAGLKHYDLGLVMKDVQRLGIAHKVHHIGFIEERDLPVVYSLADVFLFPSLWEGFGFPALEAMACGTPVVTSNTTSLPEVVGDAALLAPPEDASAIAEGLRAFLTEPALRKEYSARGLERAKLFDWKKTARRTLDVLCRNARQ